MGRIRISVVIPVYNAEKHLDQCIQSILKQTIRDIEVILVDDGSKDNSLSICRKYIGISDVAVQVIHQENSGSSLARKRGVFEAKGDYIGFVDADDYIDENMYEAMITKAKESNADVVLCGISYLRDKTVTAFDSRIPAGIYTSERLTWLKENACMDGCKEANKVIAPSLCNKIIKREIILNHLTEVDCRLSMGDDWVVAYPCVWDAKTLVVMSECFYVYRYNTEGITKGYNAYMWSDIDRLLNVAMHIKEKNNYQMDHYYHTYFQYMILLCLLNETRVQDDVGYFDLRQKIGMALNGPASQYAFEGKVARFPGKYLNVIAFFVKHHAIGITAVLLLILRWKRKK